MKQSKISNNTSSISSLPNVYASYEVGGRLGKVAVIDPNNNNRILAHIPVGARPGSMCTSILGTKVYVVNTGESTVSVINTETNRVETTLHVGNDTSIQAPAAPVAVIVSTYGDKAYVANSNNNTVTVIDANQDKVLKNVSVGRGQPFAFAVSENSSLVFVACRYKDNQDYIVTISTEDESVLAYGMDDELTFDPPPLYFKELASFKGQDQIRISPVGGHACITIQATADNPSGLQIIYPGGERGQFIELYYAGDLAVDTFSTKAYVEQRSVIVPIDLATATAGEPIEIISGSSGQTILLKDVLASYEYQNAGALVNL